MLNIDSDFKIDEKAIHAPNLCDRFSDRDLLTIGEWCHHQYEQDQQSRRQWLERNKAGMKLALQVQEQKSFPWPNAANIKFPLVTIAALQFHARAYPALVDGAHIVKMRVPGEDPSGALTQAALRIEDHMSWQVLEQDEGWEEDTDKALLNVSIVGCGFKKSYFSSAKGHNVSEFVQAKDLVVNYWTRNINEAMVKSHIIPFFRNDIVSRVRTGVFRDVLEEGWYKEFPQNYQDYSDQGQDERQGVSPPEPSEATPFNFVEQHCWIDLDNDGYAEPYIITFEESSGYIVRMVLRFGRIEDIEYNKKHEIIRINADEYFTKIPFIPSPDGGFYDIGFGVLLGPLNESVDSAMNQLFDAGTLANTAGGFLGRGAKLRGGRYSFSPFQWNNVEVTGGDLQKNVFPLPVRQPSEVLFNLLTFVVDYASRISGATESMTGVNPGQNTPAETNRTTVEQGQKVYSAIFKRIWRSMKQEFKKLYSLNSVYLPATVTFGSNANKVSRSDYLMSPGSVVPAADPFIISDTARIQQATVLRNAAETNYGYDRDAVERIFLRALGIKDAKAVYPGMQKMGNPPPSEKLQIEQMRQQAAQAQRHTDILKFMADLQETRRVNDARIAEMMAKADAYQAQADTAEGNQRINAYNAAINAYREQNNVIGNQINMLLKELSNGGSGNQTGGAGGAVSGLEGAPNNQGSDGGTEGGAGASQGELG